MADFDADTSHLRGEMNHPTLKVARSDLARSHLGRGMRVILPPKVADFDADTSHLRGEMNHPTLKVARSDGFEDAPEHLFR